MNDKIIIRNRTDVGVPRIQIHARSSPSVEWISTENIRIHLMKRHLRFEIDITMAEVLDHAVSFEELPMHLIEMSCLLKKPFVYNDYDYLRRSVRQVSCCVSRKVQQVRLQYEIVYWTTLAQEEQIEVVLKRLFVDNNAYAITQIGRAHV